MSFHRASNQSDPELRREIQAVLSRNQIGRSPNSKITQGIQYLFFLLQQQSMHLFRYLYSRGKLGERIEDYQKNAEPDGRGFYLLKNATYSSERILPPGTGILSECLTKKSLDEELDEVDFSELVADPYEIRKFIAEKKE